MPTSSHNIPYVNLAAQHAPLKAELLAAVERVLDHGQFILGPEVGQFEEQFAQLCGTRYAVGVASGTDALILALRAIGVQPGDEIITVPNSFVATASAIRLLGAKPVFVDVGPDYNLDPARLVTAVTANTRAILPVHLTGRPCNMDEILSIAQAHGLAVIEDCAQAVLAAYRGAPVGSLGAIGCFSLHPLKTLNACGDGGMLTTNDRGLYEQLLVLRNLGLRTRDDCVAWSHNSRLDTMQAAMLSVKLKHLAAWTEGRRAHSARYQQQLAGISQIQTPQPGPHERSVYHTFVIRAQRRDELKAFLNDQGIGTSIHYPVPIHLCAAAMELGYVPGSFPMAEQQAAEILSLPIYPELSTAQIDHICAAIAAFYQPPQG